MAIASATDQVAGPASQRSKLPIQQQRQLDFLTLG